MFRPNTIPFYIVICSFICIPVFAFSQNQINDSILLSSTGVCHSNSYLDGGVHSIWIDYTTPIIIENKNLDFSKLTYHIEGGTYKHENTSNIIQLIPFEKNVKITLTYKNLYTKDFSLYARDYLYFSDIRLVIAKDTLTKKIKRSSITKVRIIALLNPETISIPEELPVYKIKSYNFKILRKYMDKNVLIEQTSSYSQLDNLKSKARKGDILLIEATIVSTRFSYIKSTKITETDIRYKSYIID